MPKTPTLEELARLQAEKDSNSAEIERLTRRNKEINRFLRKYSKQEQEVKKLTKKSLISELRLPMRPYRVLVGQGVNTISELIEFTEIDLLKMPLAGRRAINEIREALEEHGFHLKPNKLTK